MPAAQMQKRADKAIAAVSVVVEATRPVSVVGTNSSTRSSNCTVCAISAPGIGLFRPGSPIQPITGAAIRIAACSRQNNQLDQTWIVAFQIADPGLTAPQIISTEAVHCALICIASAGRWSNHRAIRPVSAPWACGYAVPRTTRSAPG
jgi:hypothetical protein